MTAQGHPRAIFTRAIERGNLVAAEASAREIGKLTLEEALRLLFLYAEKDPVRYERAALRWLSRYLAEGKAVRLKWPSARVRVQRPDDRKVHT
jgi:hypothetical protein